MATRCEARIRKTDVTAYPISCHIHLNRNMRGRLVGPA